MCASYHSVYSLLIYYLWHLLAGRSCQIFCNGCMMPRMDTQKLTRIATSADNLKRLNAITLALGAQRQQDALDAIVWTAYQCIVKGKAINAEQPFKLRRGAKRGVNLKLANQVKREAEAAKQAAAPQVPEDGFTITP